MVVLWTTLSDTSLLRVLNSKVTILIKVNPLSSASTLPPRSNSKSLDTKTFNPRASINSKLPSLNNPSSSHGAYLRSTRMLAPKANLFQRTQEAMAELQPPVSIRICFPTRDNCEKWEGVAGALTSGLEMKRQLDRVQSEIRVAQLRLQSAPALPETGPAVTATAMSTPTPAADTPLVMEVPRDADSSTGV